MAKTVKRLLKRLYIISCVIIGPNKEYEKLYEFAPCGYITLDSNGLITRANLTAVELLHAERRILLNSTFSRFVSPGYENMFLTAQRKAEMTGENQRLQLPLKQDTQLHVWLELSLEPERNDADHLVQYDTSNSHQRNFKKHNRE